MAIKSMTLTQRIASLNAEGLALLRDDNAKELARVRRELDAMQVRLEAQRRRKAQHKRKLRDVKPARTMAQEVERFRKAVTTRKVKLAVTPEGSQEWYRTRRGLELAERTLAKFESYMALLDSCVCVSPDLLKRRPSEIPQEVPLEVTHCLFT